MAVISQKFSIENLVNSSISPSASISSSICSAPKPSVFPLRKLPTTYERNLLNGSFPGTLENAPQFSSVNSFMNLTTNEDHEKSRLSHSENSPSPSAFSVPSDNGENDAHLSGYSSSSEETVICPETNASLTSRGNQAPIRQTLSYLDVIFPHIQMICGNIDSTSVGLRKATEMDCDEEKKDEVVDTISKPDEKKFTKEWLELVQNSFFNFPSHSGDVRPNVPFPAASANGANGFFFQQMQKSKRNRTAFSTQQLDHLEQAFRSNHYVIGNERKNLAECLNLSETQVKVWFQNRRTKQKRVECSDNTTNHV